jgi:hypothetical protein
MAANSLCGEHDMGERILKTLAGVAVLASIAVSYGLAQEIGPEAKGLVPRMAGHVIRTRHGTEIHALSLPAKKETLLYRAAGKSADLPTTIHGVSGPDSSGRVAYLEDRSLGNGRLHHVLKIIQLDGRSDREICSGEAASGELGTHLALSPQGGKVALLQQLSAVPMPERTLYEGQLEIWDVSNGKRLSVDERALDQPLSWFPDGRRLAFTKLVDRDELPSDAKGLDTFGLYQGQEWSHVPVTHTFDLDTGKAEFLHVGWTPIVACDGRSVLVGGWNQWAKFSWNRLDLETHESSPVEWPGNVGGAIAVASDNVVLYTGQPTLSRQAKANRPAKGKQPLTLKVAALASQEFQTLISYIEERDFISFGQVGR